MVEFWCRSLWNLFLGVLMCYIAEKSLGRCMLDYGGKRTVPEYMNNTCELWDFTKEVAADALQSVELVLLIKLFHICFVILLLSLFIAVRWGATCTSAFFWAIYMWSVQVIFSWMWVVNIVSSKDTSGSRAAMIYLKSLRSLVGVNSITIQIG